jgi:hypothetical protein
VAHTYNPSYSRGRDQEDSCSKPTWTNSLQDPISKKPITKRGLVEWLKVEALSSNPSATKKKKKKQACTPQTAAQGIPNLCMPLMFPSTLSHFLSSV